MLRRIRQIMELLLGYKYWLVVVHRRGSEIYEVSSNLFKSKDAALAFRDEAMLGNTTFEFVEIVSFRSWVDYVNIYGREARDERKV